MQFSIQIQGGDEVEAALARLPGKVARKVVRQALRKGTKIIQAAAKTNARSKVGGEMGSLIAKALKIKVQKKRQPGEYTLNLLPSKKYNDQFVHETKDGQRYYIPAAIEYGHAFPGRGGGEHPPKDVRAIGYMRKAFRVTAERATRIAEDELRKGIEREAEGIA